MPTGMINKWWKTFHKLSSNNRTRNQILFKIKIKWEAIVRPEKIILILSLHLKKKFGKKYMLGAIYITYWFPSHQRSRSKSLNVVACLQIWQAAINVCFCVFKIFHGLVFTVWQIHSAYKTSHLAKIVSKFSSFDFEMWFTFKTRVYFHSFTNNFEKLLDIWRPMRRRRFLRA